MALGRHFLVVRQAHSGPKGRGGRLNWSRSDLGSVLIGHLRKTSLGWGNEQFGRIPPSGQVGQTGLPSQSIWDIWRATRFESRRWSQRSSSSFADSRWLTLERLRAAMSEGDWRDAAHSLKGSARAVGAFWAAQAAERAEALQGDVFEQVRATWIDEIEASLREAEAYSACLLKQR